MKKFGKILKGTMKEQNSHGTRLERFSKSNSKPIIAIDIANGEYNEYNSGKECAIQLGLNHGHISSVLTGKRRQTGGYVFKYLDKSLDT
ncbi:HNH endonuclease [Enterococcus phage IME-EFm1]|uniref:HNH endonuclease family protein n=1 Tax=Enterococcus phage IME-EFm1 TaxID=1445858 RepID=A0A060AHH2_9CAUD|nr:HNH endonuclease [Enterococcus phage IME-EFm1]AIA65106.1 HNH endonuclease family protein [Enterococcus phage IME-EFm1]